MTNNYKSGDGIWFKRCPVNEDALPNAEFVRDMGLLNGEPIYEIIYCKKRWTVRYSEISGSVQDFVKKLRQRIIDNTLLKQTKKDLAVSLGISYSTLRRWEKLIAKYARSETA